ncbi:MAG: proteasome accessory factor PafA2 family protein [Nitrospinota bacterium]|nr:proteasome accessory factor PafA2 family protein [Nitrospinota bacterium]
MSDIVPLMGIETEYGIIRENVEVSDPVHESMALLKRCPMKSVPDLWAYSRESSHQDQRGFSVSQLAQDREEDEFCKEDRKRPYSYLEMKCDRVLANGSRFYNDHTHPEYSSPECRDIFQLVAHDRAGEKILAECARLRNLDIGENALQLYKNNTDYSGHSYGTHENYLIPRKLSFEYWVDRLTPFLVTRQLYAGAGKVGSETKKSEPFTGLQLSQRADFIETLLSIETMTQRPIINTRDEPHASNRKFRRLHLILGDANMSPYATALKVGTTQLVLTLIGEEKPFAFAKLANPVDDIKRLSRDKTGGVLLKQKTGKTITPLEIQSEYLAKVKRHYEGCRKDWDWVIREWERTLNDLRGQPENLADRIDWAIKKKLFDQFQKSEDVDWEDPWMQSLDLEYHNLDAERGLYRGLEQEGSLVGVCTDREVEHAIHQPPEGTRSIIRGQVVESCADDVKNIHWTGVEFKNGDTIDLSGVIDPAEVEQMLKKISKNALQPNR